MGNKVNSNIFRSYINLDKYNNWFKVKKKYSDTLLRDQKLRQMISIYLRDFLGENFFIDNISIYRIEKKFKKENKNLIKIFISLLGFKLRSESKSNDIQTDTSDDLDLDDIIVDENFIKLSDNEDIITDVIEKENLDDLSQEKYSSIIDGYEVFDQKEVDEEKDISEKLIEVELFNNNLDINILKKEDLDEIENLKQEEIKEDTTEIIEDTTEIKENKEDINEGKEEIKENTEETNEDTEKTDISISKIIDSLKHFVLTFDETIQDVSFFINQAERNTAELVSQEIAFKLTRRLNIKNSINLILERLKNDSMIRGAKIILSGRLSSDEKAVKYKFYFGCLGLQTLDSNVTYAYNNLLNIDGISGIKVWIAYY